MGESRSSSSSPPAPKAELRPKGEGWDLGPMASHFLAEGSMAMDVVMRIRTWLDLLVTWNAKLDLTAARSEGELLDLMLADALAFCSRLPQGARVVDIGSGAGAPGLPLALLRPDLAVTLVEPLAKRISFLRTVIGATGRLDIKIHHGKSQTLAPRTWDVAISRATFAPPEWLEAGRGLVEPQGSVWVLLAREEPPSAEGMELAESFTYSWPNQGRPRRAVRYLRAQ